jgi:TorA maturation chaperone TorD
MDASVNADKGLYAAIASCGEVLGALFAQDPQATEVQPLLAALRGMPDFAEWPFGDTDILAQAYGLMSGGLAAVPDTTERLNPLACEYQRLFIGPHHFKAPAWGSVYLDRESVLFGSSTLELRQWLREQGITVKSDKREPEDHIGKMLLLLAWLAEERPGLVGGFLSEHLMPWAPRYLGLLADDARQPFYQGLAVLTRATLDGIAAELAVVPAKRKLYF